MRPVFAKKKKETKKLNDFNVEKETRYSIDKKNIVITFVLLTCSIWYYCTTVYG